MCNRPWHLAKDCYKRVGSPATQRSGFRGAGSYSHQFGSRENRGEGQVKLCTTREPVRTVRVQECSVQCEREGHCGLTETSWEFGDYPIVKSVTTYLVRRSLFPLQYLEVSIEGNKCTVLNDSGCQIPIVSNRLFG